MPTPLTPAPIQSPLVGNAMIIGGSAWSTWFQLLRDWVLGFNNTATSSGDAKMNEVYISDSVSLLTLTLPSRFAVGDTFQILGQGAGGWEIQLNTGQFIRGGASTTSSGGTISSTNRYDTMTLKVKVKDTELAVVSHEGTLTYA